VALTHAKMKGGCHLRSARQLCNMCNEKIPGSPSGRVARNHLAVGATCSGSGGGVPARVKAVVRPRRVDGQLVLSAALRASSLPLEVPAWW